MTEASSFLQELNEAVLRGSRENRARALWHATDLLIAGRYTEDQIWVFGEVIGRLADEIELAARAKLAKLLAHSDNAPFNIVMLLAFDDSIEVAGPVLQHSQRLDTKGCLFLHTPIEARNEALGKPTKRPRYSFCLSLSILIAASPLIEIAIRCFQQMGRRRRD